MRDSIAILAKISHVDKILDDFKEEMGDLPELIKSKKEEIQNAKKTVIETEQIIADIREFVKAAKNTLVTLKEKEDKLTEQQFMVRNNKEFDAIAAEITNLKDEHEKLSIKMRTEGVKEENLIVILGKQRQTFEELQNQLVDLNNEMEELSLEQNDDIAKLTATRKILKAQMNESLFDRYDKIRGRIPDAAVIVRDSSCSGCFRQIPQQIIVEMRNQPDRVFQCENCGRLLLPEDIVIDEEELYNM